MPVSGNEEPGFKPIARNSSDSIAGIPIKKRRFPLVRPPSPPKADSLPPVENDLLQKEPFNLSQESSLTDASVATSSSCLSIAKENLYLEETGEKYSDGTLSLAHNFPNLGKVKVEEPSVIINSDFVEDIERKSKLKLDEKSAHRIDSGNAQLQLATQQNFAQNIGGKIVSKRKAEGDSRSESSPYPGNTELSLGPKEYLVPALAGEKIEESYLMQGKLDHISLNLSSSKGKSTYECRRGEVELNVNGASMCANRSNWDLNTTMDAWDGPVSDATAGEVAIGVRQLDGTRGSNDVKPLISSTTMVGAGDSGKRRLEDSEGRSSFSVSSMTPYPQHKSDDFLNLCLTPSCLQTSFLCEKTSSLPKVDKSRDRRIIALPKTKVPANLNVTAHRNVKSEPYDESNNPDPRRTNAGFSRVLDRKYVKSELVERRGPLEPVNSSTPKLVGSGLNSEPFREASQEINETAGSTLNPSDKRVPDCGANCSSNLDMSITAQEAIKSGIPSRSKELFGSRYSLHCSENSTYIEKVYPSEKMPPEDSERTEQIASKVVSTSIGQEVKEPNVSDGEVNAQETLNLNFHDLNELGRFKLTDKLRLEACGNGDGSISDEEKFDISTDMLEEDSYGSDSESDGNHDLDTGMNIEHGGRDDDFEDGEVREPLVNVATEGCTYEKREPEDLNIGGTDQNNTNISVLTGDDVPSSIVEQKDTNIEDSGQTNNDHSRDSGDTVLDEKIDQGTNQDTSLQESSASEMPAAGEDTKYPLTITRRFLLDRSGKKHVPGGQETEQSSEQATNGGQVATEILNQGAQENIKGTEQVEKNDPALPKAEASLHGGDAAKDATSGNRSRIINLSKASNVSTSFKSRFIPGRSLSSRSSGERFADLVLEGDKLPSRGREQVYSDNPHKFLRGRDHDKSFRTSRLNFIRGRGRGSSRLSTMRGDWNSDRDFPSELYNDSSEFRFPRQKHGSAATESELESDSYVGPEDPIMGPGRGRRKPLNDEMPGFHQVPSRRRSPLREGPIRGVQMIRRVPRNISPSRCIGEDGSELVGLRHSEKFMRGLPDDIMDPMFSRTQPPFEAMDGQFVPGGRNFTSIHGRCLPRIRSKSPMKSGTRSPGSWSSPRRRSPDSFNGHPGLAHRRSPAMYRMDRMRSPDRPCFPAELVARRHGSPPFLPRLSSDLDSGRDHVHSRSIICERSPSGRVLPRSNRRFDIVDHRERIDADEYFGGPMHPGRFHELAGEGSSDERRRCGERRGPVRPFQPHHGGVDGENFRFNAEDGPRAYRFGPEVDSEFNERGNLREREFERRIKSRIGHAPRRMRGIEEQEGNYRPAGQVWHEDGLDNTRLKRRRF